MLKDWFTNNFSVKTEQCNLNINCTESSHELGLCQDGSGHFKWFNCGAESANSTWVDLLDVCKGKINAR